MNLKQGLRRLFIVILSLLTSYFLLIYIVGGGIFWRIDYISEAKVQNLTKLEETQSLIDFSQKYFEKKEKIYYTGYFETLGFRIHPYSRFFINYDGHIFKDKEIYTINNIKYQIQLPTAQKYFFTQLWQFLLIPLGITLLFALYIFVEWVIIWISKGFKIN